jgi:hypothetical protein
MLWQTDFATPDFATPNLPWHWWHLYKQAYPQAGFGLIGYPSSVGQETHGSFGADQVVAF